MDDTERSFPSFFFLFFPFWLVLPAFETLPRGSTRTEKRFEVSTRGPSVGTGPTGGRPESSRELLCGGRCQCVSSARGSHVTANQKVRPCFPSAPAVPSSIWGWEVATRDQDHVTRFVNCVAPQTTPSRPLATWRREAGRGGESSQSSLEICLSSRIACLARFPRPALHPTHINRTPQRIRLCTYVFSFSFCDETSSFFALIDDVSYHHRPSPHPL